MSSDNRVCLHDLGLRYGTDKACPHDYLVHYDRCFSELRDSPLTLLEVGVAQGASLRMWRDYFHRGSVCGIDVDPETMFGEDRIRTFCGDQQDGAFLKQVVACIGAPLIIVDDGCHRGDYQVDLFASLWPSLQVGGWYCVEDCYSISLPRLATPGEPTIMDTIYDKRMKLLTGQSEIKEVRIIGNGPCDGLIIFRKGKRWKEVPQ